MKKMSLLLSVGILSAFLASCSQSSSNSATCSKSGMFGGQTECQSSIAGVGTCSMTTISSSGNSTVCWQQVSTNSYTSTSTSTGMSCVGSAAPPWTKGAWTPATCSSGVTRTRTVTCDYNCACSGTMPSTTETCTGDLYGNTHFSDQCTSGGGSVETVDGYKVCSFGASSCPGGWTQLTNSGNGIAYTKTTPGSGTEHTSCSGGRATRNTGSHGGFVPAIPVESISLCTWKTCTGCKGYTTFYANVVRVACY